MFGHRSPGLKTNETNETRHTTGSKFQNETQNACGTITNCKVITALWVCGFMCECVCECGCGHECLFCAGSSLSYIYISQAASILDSRDTRTMEIKQGSQRSARSLVSPQSC